MEIIISIGLGLLAGILALYAIHRSFPQDMWGWVGALVIGMIGGWLGGWLFRIMGLEAVNWIGSLVVAFVGAAALLWLLNKMGPKTTAGRPTLM